MLRKIYNLCLAPKQLHEDARNRELVLNILLGSTLSILYLSLPLFIYSFAVFHQDFALRRMIWAFALLLLVGFFYALSRWGRYRLSALLLVILYFLLAFGVASQWGITAPVGPLLFGLVIVLAGILLGPTYSLYSAGVVIATLLSLHFATIHGVTHPDLSWTVDAPRTGDIIGFSLIFIILAVVSWLFNVQMERSLHRAERAERALQRQKASLERTVAERTQQLQVEQLEKIQQMYRFAELGQLSTALLHDLANHLTTITLDIEGLEAKESTGVLRRAKRSIHYIDNAVQRVREQLHGKSKSRLFNVVHQLDEVTAILRHKASQADVRLLWQPPSDRHALRCRGNIVRFHQLMANLVSNAIEAYDRGHTGPNKRVEVTTVAQGEHVIITISDWGKGIATEDRAKLFEPFFSTKKTGMGMGLFIARQITEEHLQGKLSIDDTKDHTVFVVTLHRASP